MLTCGMPTLFQVVTILSTIPNLLRQGVPNVSGTLRWTRESVYPKHSAFGRHR